MGIKSNHVLQCIAALSQPVVVELGPELTMLDCSRMLQQSRRQGQNAAIAVERWPHLAKLAQTLPFFPAHLLHHPLGRCQALLQHGSCCSSCRSCRPSICSSTRPTSTRPTPSPYVMRIYSWLPAGDQRCALPAPWLSCALRYLLWGLVIALGSRTDDTWKPDVIISQKIVIARSVHVRTYGL